MADFSHMKNKKVDLEVLRSISIDARALPTRSPSYAAKVREKPFGEDNEAYRRLRKEGFQPDKVDGAAELERRAEDGIASERELNAI